MLIQMCKRKRRSLLSRVRHHGKSDSEGFNVCFILTFFWSESSALADVMSSQESEEEPAAAAVKPQKKYYAVGGVTVNPP